MERLTQRFANGQVGVSGCGSNCKYDYKYCNNRAENCPTFDELYEKLAAYEDTGLTPEECKEAAEKQRAKKPNLEGDGYADGHMVYDTWICPCCGISYEVDYDDYKYCPDCGQYIDWSE